MAAKADAMTEAEVRALIRHNAKQILHALEFLDTAQGSISVLDHAERICILVPQWVKARAEMEHK